MSYHRLHRLHCLGSTPRAPPPPLLSPGHRPPDHCPLDSTPWRGAATCVSARPVYMSSHGHTGSRYVVLSAELIVAAASRRSARSLLSCAACTGGWEGWTEGWTEG